MNDLQAAHHTRCRPGRVAQDDEVADAVGWVFGGAQSITGQAGVVQRREVRC